MPLPMIESEHDNMTPVQGHACPARTTDILNNIVKDGNFDLSGSKGTP
jgi:hypothetical protein